MSSAPVEVGELHEERIPLLGIYVSIRTGDEQIITDVGSEDGGFDCDDARSPRQNWLTPIM